MGLFKDFREFAMKGNVIDLAVGVIIGAAFGAIVTSLVSDVLMPPVGKLVGNLDFTNLYISLSDAIDQQNKQKAAQVATSEPAAGKSVIPEVFSTHTRLTLDEARKFGPVIAYGKFITAVINFIIVAMCIFAIVKAMNIAKRRFERQQAIAPPPPPDDVVLLREIRDILKEQKT